MKTLYLLTGPIQLKKVEGRSLRYKLTQQKTLLDRKLETRSLWWSVLS